MLPLSLPHIALLLSSQLALRAAAALSEQWSFNSQHPLVARANSAYSYTLSDITFQDTDAAAHVSYALQNSPSWLSIDPLSGTLSGTPSSADSDATFDIVVSDSTSSYTATANKLPVSSQAAPAVKNSSTVLQQLQRFSATNGANSIVYPQNTDFSFSFSKSDTFALPHQDSTTYYFYAFSSGNTPLPIWMNFREDGDSLVFSGTTPVVNSEIAPAQSFSLNLVASDIDGYSGVIVPFGISVGFHVLELTRDTSVNLSIKSDNVFNYSAPLDAIHLDGSQISKSDISVFQLDFNSSTIPSWLQVDTANIAIYGEAPNNTETLTFDMQVSDKFGNSVFIPYVLHIESSSSSSTSSSSSSSSSITAFSSTTATSSTSSSTTMATSTTATVASATPSNNADSGLLNTSAFPTSLNATQGEKFNYTFTNDMFLNQNATELTVTNASTPAANWLHYSNFSIYGNVPKNFSGDITVQVAAAYLLSKRENSQQGNTVSFTIHSVASSGMSRSKKLAIILGVILPIVFIILVLLLIFFLCRSKKSASKKKNNDLEKNAGTASSANNTTVIGSPKIIGAKALTSSPAHSKLDSNCSDVSSSKDEQHTTSTTFDYLSKGLLFKDRPNGIPPHLVNANDDSVAITPTIEDADDGEHTVAGAKAYTTSVANPTSTIRKVASSASSTGFFVEKGKFSANNLGEGISEPDDGITTKNWIVFPTEEGKGDENYVVYDNNKYMRSVSKTNSETEDSDIYYDAEVKREFKNGNHKDDDDDKNNSNNHGSNDDQSNGSGNGNNADFNHSKDNAPAESDHDDTYHQHDSSMNNTQDYSKYDSMISDNAFNDLADSILENSLNPTQSIHNESLLSNHQTPPSNTSNTIDQQSNSNVRNTVTSSRYNSMNSVGSDSGNGSDSAPSRSGSDLPLDTTNETSYDTSTGSNTNNVNNIDDGNHIVKTQIIPKKSWRQVSDSSIASGVNGNITAEQVTYSVRMADDNKAKFESAMQETATKDISLSREDSGNFKHLDSRGNSISSSALQTNSSSTNMNSANSNRNSRASGASSNEFGKEDFNALENDENSNHKRDDSGSGSGSGDSKKSRTSGNGLLNVSSSNLHVLKEEGENNTSEYFYFYDDSGLRNVSANGDALTDAEKSDILGNLNSNQNKVHHPIGDSFSKIVISPAHRVIFSDSENT